MSLHSYKIYLRYKRGVLFKENIQKRVYVNMGQQNCFTYYKYSHTKNKTFFIDEDLFDFYVDKL